MNTYATDLTKAIPISILTLGQHSTLFTHHHDYIVCLLLSFPAGKHFVFSMTLITASLHSPYTPDFWRLKFPNSHVSTQDDSML